jgi:hypothetical protein
MTAAVHCHSVFLVMESAMPFDSRLTDKRSNKRFRVLNQGKIASLNMTGTVDVSIRDFSVGGARVSSPHVGFPRDFGLLVVSENLFYPAELRWNCGVMTGIRFVGEPRHTSIRKWN